MRPRGKSFLFTIEELEDLHRGLAFDAQPDHDKKRRKDDQKGLATRSKRSIDERKTMIR